MMSEKKIQVYETSSELGIIVENDSNMKRPNNLDLLYASVARNWKLVLFAALAALCLISFGMIRRFGSPNPVASELVEKPQPLVIDDDTMTNTTRFVDDLLNRSFILNYGPCSLSQATVHSINQPDCCIGLFLTHTFVLFSGDCCCGQLVNRTDVEIDDDSGEVIDAVDVQLIGRGDLLCMAELSRPKLQSGSVCVSDRSWSSSESLSVLVGPFGESVSSGNCSLRGGGESKLANSSCASLPSLLRTAARRPVDDDRRVLFGFSQTSSGGVYLDGVYLKENDSSADEFVYLGRYLSEIRERIQQSAARSNLTIDRDITTEESTPSTTQARTQPSSRPFTQATTVTKMDVVLKPRPKPTTTTTTKKTTTSPTTTKKVIKKYSYESNRSYEINFNNSCKNLIMVPITRSDNDREPLCVGYLITAIFILYPSGCIRRGANSSAFAAQLPFSNTTNGQLKTRNGHYLRAAHSIANAHVIEVGSMAIMKVNLKPGSVFYSTTCILPANRTTNQTDIHVYSGYGRGGTYNWVSIDGGAKNCFDSSRFSQFEVARSNCSWLPRFLRNTLDESANTTGPLFDRTIFFSIVEINGEKFLNGIYSMDPVSADGDVFRTFRDLVTRIQGVLEESRREDFKEADSSS